MPSKKQRAKGAKSAAMDVAIQQALEQAAVAGQRGPSDPTSGSDAYIMKVCSLSDKTMCPSCNDAGTRAYACANATLHMINPTLGMTPGNIQWVCCFVNGLTPEQVAAVSNACALK